MLMVVSRHALRNRYLISKPVIKMGHSLKPLYPLSHHIGHCVTALPPPRLTEPILANAITTDAVRRCQVQPPGPGPARAPPCLHCSRTVPLAPPARQIRCLEQRDNCKASLVLQRHLKPEIALASESDSERLLHFNLALCNRTCTELKYCKCMLTAFHFTIHR